MSYLFAIGSRDFTFQCCSPLRYKKKRQKIHKTVRQFNKKKLKKDRIYSPPQRHVRFLWRVSKQVQRQGRNEILFVFLIWAMKREEEGNQVTSYLGGVREVERTLENSLFGKHLPDSCFSKPGSNITLEALWDPFFTCGGVSGHKLFWGHSQLFKGKPPEWRWAFAMKFIQDVGFRVGNSKP